MHLDRIIRGATVVTGGDARIQDIGIAQGRAALGISLAAGIEQEARDSFGNISNRIPAVETRLPILFSEGVVKGRIGLSRFAAIKATNQAHRYGLATPREGFEVTGWPAASFLRDEFLLHENKLAEHRGGGVECGQPDQRAWQ